jgi:hypothetical protein
MLIGRHVVWVSCALLLLTRTVHAESPDQATRTAASALGYAGVEAFQAGDYAGASERLEKAYALLKAPSLGLWSARALLKLGRLVQASERYLEVTQLAAATGDAAIQKQAQQDAARELDELGPKIPRVMIAIVGAAAWDVTVSVDAIPIASAQRQAPVPLDPGRRVIEGRQGEQTVRTELVLMEGQHTTVELRFTGTPAAPTAARAAARATDAPWRTLGWVALVLGGASLTAGAALGVSALDDRSHFKSSEECDLDRNQCWLDERSRVDAYNTKRVLSGVGLIAGGVLAATGAYLVFFRTDATPESPSVGLRVAAGSIALRAQY